MGSHHIGWNGRKRYINHVKFKRHIDWETFYIWTKKNDYRIKKFRELFTKLNIIKKLENELETWHYEILDETSRIANEIKKQLT